MQLYCSPQLLLPVPPSPSPAVSGRREARLGQEKTGGVGEWEDGETDLSSLEVCE